MKINEIITESVAEGTEMKRITGYNVIDKDGKEVIGKNGKVLFIPILDWESFDGRYYELKGYEFEPVWSQPTQDMSEDSLPEHIVKVSGGYELKSKHGDKNLGKYPTRAGAEKRERQVQYFKHAK